MGAYWTAGALAALRGEVLPKNEDEDGMSDAAARPKAVCVVEEDKGDDMADVIEVKDEPVEAADVEEVPVRAKTGKKQAPAAVKEDVVMVDEDAAVKAAPKKKKAVLAAKKAGDAKQKGSKKTGDKLLAGKKSASSVDAVRRKPRSALRK